MDKSDVCGGVQMEQMGFLKPDGCVDNCMTIMCTFTDLPGAALVNVASHLGAKDTLAMMMSTSLIAKMLPRTLARDKAAAEKRAELVRQEKELNRMFRDMLIRQPKENVRSLLLGAIAATQLLASLV